MQSVNKASRLQLQLNSMQPSTSTSASEMESQAASSDHSTITEVDRDDQPSTAKVNFSWISLWPNSRLKRALFLVVITLVVILACTTVVVVMHLNAKAIRKELTAKTMNAFSHPPNGAKGRRIWAKKTAGCIDRKSVNGTQIYYSRPEGECKDALLWVMDKTGRLIGTKIRDEFLVLATGQEMVANKKRVFFVLQSHEERHLCLGLCLRGCNPSDAIKPMECSEEEEQQFYLKDVEY